MRGKIGATLVLHAAGWTTAEIASAVVQSEDDVRRWIADPHRRRTDRDGSHRPLVVACQMCGVEGQTQNNHLCSPCGRLRDEAMWEMRNNGARWDEIGEAVNLSPGSARQAAHRYRRGLSRGAAT